MALNEITYPLDVYQLLGVIGVLRAAIVQTLDDNSYLADGEDCTLSMLKKALREVNMAWEEDGEVKPQETGVDKVSYEAHFGLGYTGFAVDGGKIDIHGDKEDK